MLGIKSVFVILALAYVALLGWYLLRVAFPKSEEQEAPKKAKKGKGHRRQGKKCPECKKVIDARRTVCQHCGYKFTPKLGRELHPDEVGVETTDENENGP